MPFRGTQNLPPNCLQVPRNRYGSWPPAPRSGPRAAYLKALWLKMFGPIFKGFKPKTDSRTPLNGFSSKSGAEFAQKSAPEIHSNAISWHPKPPARLPSSTQQQIWKLAAGTSIWSKGWVPEGILAKNVRAGFQGF